MGNSVRPVHVPVCLNATGHGYPAPTSGWDADRVAHSVFSPVSVALDQEFPGTIPAPERKPWRPEEELLAEIKGSDAWKSFMSQYETEKPKMEAEDLDVRSEEETDAPPPDLREETEKVFKDIFKSNLHILKEKTGFPYSFCKKALEASDNDLEKAEEWLEQESKELGLEKLRKIGQRKSPEGLVGVAWERRHAAVVEVNSETDFVSGHEKFHELVDLVARTCLRHNKETNPQPEAGVSQVTLKGDEIGQLVADDKASLADHLATTIALMGERLRLRRAALVSAEDSARIAVLTHSSEQSAEYRDVGTMATVLVYKAEVENDCSRKLAKQLCQHIIAMKPKSLEPSQEVSQDSALLTQQFLHDSGQTVADVTLRGGLKIQHFVRFERGEPGDDPADLGTQDAKPLC